jgi:NADPH2:quinone reductase
MKALYCTQWGGYKALDYTDVAPPALRAGCVRIDVHYATITLGQVLVVAGKYQRKPPLPFVPGTEVSGVISEIGPEVSGFRVGDRVAAMLDWGGFGEEAIATAETVWRVPDAIDLSVACTVPGTYGTAYASLHWRAALRPGHTVLVFGAAGGVGIPAIEVAAQAGAHVIAVARTQERLDLARAHGAHEGVLNDTPDLGKTIKARTGGRGIDIVFDPVGGSMFDEALRCVAPEGKIVVIGFASGSVPQIPANILLVKNVDVIGFNFGLYLGWTPDDERKRFAARLRELMAVLCDGILKGDFKPVTSATWPLARYLEAFDALVERQSVGRVVLKIRD